MQVSRVGITIFAEPLMVSVYWDSSTAISRWSGSRFRAGCRADR